MKRPISFQRKLFLYYSILVVFIFFISVTSFYFYLSKTSQNQSIENMKQLTVKTCDQLDMIFLEMNRLSIQVSTNPVSISTFSRASLSSSKDNYFSYNFEDSKILGNTLISINGSNFTASRISLFNLKGDYYHMGTYSDSPIASQNFIYGDKCKQLYNKLLVANGQCVILPPHDDFWSFDKNLQFVSLFRKITDIQSNNFYGIVEIQQPMIKIDDLFQSLNKDIKPYIFSNEGTIVYPKVNISGLKTTTIAKYYLDNINNTIKNESETKHLKNPQNGETEIVTYSKSSYLGWTVVLVQPIEGIIAPIKVVTNIMLLIALILLLLSVLVIFIITNYLTSPLKQLRKSIKLVNLDNLSLDISSSNANNELLQLNNAFNSMFKRLQISINQEIQSRDHEIKAQLFALQSQMNPHFLYNTLSVINAIGQEAGVMKIMDVCSKLSNMLRYVTSYNDGNIRIRDEVQHGKDYLDLMKARYEDRFSYDLSINKNVLEVITPKLILQPLIENCFQHAFKDSRPPWKIKIFVGKTKTKWFIIVSDNGKGFDTAMISQLKDKADILSKNPTSAINDLKLGGLGFLNIYIRLKILYGDNMIFKIGKNSLNGAKITIGGPLND